MGRIRSPQDAATGVFLILVAALAWYFGRGLVVGTTMRMGPGYVPMLLAGCILILGVVILTTSFLNDGPALEAWGLRPVVLVLAAFTSFGLLIERGGLVLACLASIVIATFAAHDRRWLETVAFGIVMVAGCVLLFVKGLGLTMKVWPW